MMYQLIDASDISLIGNIKDLILIRFYLISRLNILSDQQEML